MTKEQAAGTGPADEFGDDGDFTDMLGELRVLLPTSQLLTAFLITVPFNPPLKDRPRFKPFASRQIVAGAFSLSLSLALIMGTQLVMSEAFGRVVGITCSVAIGLMIGVFWWVVPKVLEFKGEV